jgi:hypothetical protein
MSYVLSFSLPLTMTSICWKIYGTHKISSHFSTEFFLYAQANNQTSDHIFLHLIHQLKKPKTFST